MPVIKTHPGAENTGINRAFASRTCRQQTKAEDESSFINLIDTSEIIAALCSGRSVYRHPRGFGVNNINFVTADDKKYSTPSTIH